jgi:hypothetical protein
LGAGSLDADGHGERLGAEGYEVKSDPMLARYSPPLTPWFLRRNEILVEVAPRS